MLNEREGGDECRYAQRESNRCGNLREDWELDGKKVSPCKWGMLEGVELEFNFFFFRGSDFGASLLREIEASTGSV